MFSRAAASQKVDAAFANLTFQQCTVADWNTALRQGIAVPISQLRLLSCTYAHCITLCHIAQQLRLRPRISHVAEAASIAFFVNRAKVSGSPDMPREESQKANSAQCSTEVCCCYNSRGISHHAVLCTCPKAKRKLQRKSISENCCSFEGEQISKNDGRWFRSGFLEANSVKHMWQPPFVQVDLSRLASQEDISRSWGQHSMKFGIETTQKKWSWKYIRIVLHIKEQHITTSSTSAGKNH